MSEPLDAVRKLHGSVRWLPWNDYPVCDECSYEVPCATGELVFSEWEIAEMRRPVDEQ